MALFGALRGGLHLKFEIVVCPIQILSRPLFYLTEQLHLCMFPPQPSAAAPPTHPPPTLPISARAEGQVRVRRTGGVERRRRGGYICSALRRTPTPMELPIPRVRPTLARTPHRRARAHRSANGPREHAGRGP